MVEKKKICPIYLISYRVKLVSAVCQDTVKQKYVMHHHEFTQPMH